MWNPIENPINTIEKLVIWLRGEISHQYCVSGCNTITPRYRAVYVVKEFKRREAKLPDNSIKSPILLHMRQHLLARNLIFAIRLGMRLSTEKMYPDVERLLIFIFPNHWCTMSLAPRWNNSKYLEWESLTKYQCKNNVPTGCSWFRQKDLLTAPLLKNHWCALQNPCWNL